MPVVPLHDSTAVDSCVYVVCFNQDGVEAKEEDGQLLSAHLASAMRWTDTPVTDVIIAAHGMGHTRNGSLTVYNDWMRALMGRVDDIAALRRARGGTGTPFRPLLVGVAWPSKFTSISSLSEMSSFIGSWVFGNTDDAEGERTLSRFQGHPFNYMLFGRLVARARRVGRIAAAGLHQKLRWAAQQQPGSATAGVVAAAPASAPIRFHAIGHSLGAHVVCAMVLGTSGVHIEAPATPPWSTVVLIQGALPHHSMHNPESLYAPIARGMAATVLVTHSTTDNSLGLYNHVHGPEDKAMGIAGATLDPATAAPPVVMGPVTTVYAFPAQPRVVNVDANAYIRNVSNATVNLQGGHGNFLGPECVHLFWSALAGRRCLRR